MIRIHVNGEPITCPSDQEIREVLIHLGYLPEVVVVELNGRILPRSRWPGQKVVESDSLEVVTIVGGGA
jgi:sulfur carrier protein